MFTQDHGPGTALANTQHRHVRNQERLGGLSRLKVTAEGPWVNTAGLLQQERVDAPEGTPQPFNEQGDGDRHRRGDRGFPAPIRKLKLCRFNDGDHGEKQVV